MPTILIASLDAGEGRTATAAGLGAGLAGEGRKVHLLRIRAGEGADPAAEDDAQTLASVPGCAATRSAVSAQDAQAQAKDAGAGDGICIVEAPPGAPGELVRRLGARVVLVAAESDDGHIGELAQATKGLGDAVLGVVATRVPPRRMAAVPKALPKQGLACLAALPEDRLLAGPTPNQMAQALHASRLAGSGSENDALAFVMLGPISADPGQPYFLRHAGKAVVNRFDKMDLHLAALATEPDCIILTGGQLPSPYFLDRLRGSGAEVTVLLSPESTVRTIEVLDDVYCRTRFSGARKVARAAELFGEYLDTAALVAALT